MATVQKVNPLTRGLCTANNTLTSGITIPSGAQQILSKFDHYSTDGVNYRLVFETNTLSKAISADAALGFGEHLFTLPTGIVQVLGVALKTSSLCPTGLSATAGEFGMGTTIASGAIATLGAGSAAMENIMEGTTIDNHVAATALTMKLFNAPVANDDHGAGSVSSSVNMGGGGVINATAGTTKAHINLASTWNQTAAESVAFSVKGVLCYRLFALDFGVE